MICGFSKISVAILALAFAAARIEAASLGDAILTVYTDPNGVQLIPEVDSGESERTRRDADEDFDDFGEARGALLHHHHHHHHIGGGGGHVEYYQKPTTSTCYKCGGGGGGGGGATFATASAGSINTGGGHGGHGGHGGGFGGLGQSVSQAAAYNFGPISASFSASQSNGGFNGFF